MNLIKEEIVLTVRDEQGSLTHIAEMNGSVKFHKLRKLNKTEIAELLAQNNPPEK